MSVSSSSPRAWRARGRFANPRSPSGHRLTGVHTTQQLIDALETRQVVIKPQDSVTPALTIYGGDSSWTPNSVQWYTQAGVLKWVVTQAGAWRFLTSTQWRDGSAVDASVQITPQTAALLFGDGTNPPDWQMSRTAADTVSLAAGDTLKGTFVDSNGNPIVTTTLGAYDPGTVSVTTEHFVLQYQHLKLSGSERLSMAGTSEMYLSNFGAYS